MGQRQEMKETSNDSRKSMCTPPTSKMCSCRRTVMRQLDYLLPAQAAIPTTPTTTMTTNHTSRVLPVLHGGHGQVGECRIGGAPAGVALADVPCLRVPCVFMPALTSLVLVPVPVPVSSMNPRMTYLDGVCTMHTPCTTAVIRHHAYQGINQGTKRHAPQ